MENNLDIPYKQRIHSYVIQRVIDNKYYEREGYTTIYWCSNLESARKYRFKFTAWWYTMFTLKDSVQIVRI